MAQPVDRNILQEIVRSLEARRKVPERVQVRAKEYLITYLEDHQRRLQEALQRYDSDRLNMLYGQLASKVKYQLLRRAPGRAAAETTAPPAKRSRGKESAPQKPARKAAPSGPKKGKLAKKAPTKKAPTKKAPTKKAPTKKAPTKKAPTKKAAGKKVAAKRVPTGKTASKRVVGRKSAAKKTPAKRVSPKRSTAKRVAPKKSAARKTAVTKAAAKKRTTKK